MLYRLTRILDQIREDVPSVLWADASFARMKTLVERFPEVPTLRTIGPVRLGVVGLELRLAQQADQVDLTFPVLKEDRDALLALADDDELGRWLREDRWWRRVLALCRLWADEGSLLSRHVKLLWLEIDVGSEVGADSGAADDALPAPGVFVGFEPRSVVDLDPDEWRELFTAVTRVLGGDEPAAPLVDRFVDLARALLARSWVQYIGCMLSRGASAVRCVVAPRPGETLETGRVEDVASAVGWPGDATALRRRLEGLCVVDGEPVHAGASALQVDLTAQAVLPRLGLELVLDRAAQSASGRIAEVSFLQELVRQGLCSAAKLEALLALPGRSVAPRGEHYLVGHTRQVHHVKLIVDHSDQGVEIEAKAYYGQSLVIERRAIPGE